MRASDFAMTGYVLIKRSQSARDDRDAARMLGLAQAAREGPWRLPARVTPVDVPSLVDGWTRIRTVDLERPIPARTLVLAQQTLPLRPAVKALSDLLVKVRPAHASSLVNEAAR